MIKLFRKIRQELLAENKLRNYLKYSVGEIILVVIGILIALSINNWNESRKQDIAEKEFITGIRHDLEQDLNYINTVIQLADKKIAIYKRLESDFSTLYDSNRKTLDSLLVEYFESQRTFYPIYGSFQSAVSGNEINKFRNKSFSADVTKLYNSFYARLRDNSNDVDNRWFYMTKVYSRARRTGHIGEMTPDQQMLFLDDMFYHVYGLQHYNGNLKATSHEINKLLEEY